MKKKITIEIISALLVLLFVYASVVKLINLDEFISDMDRQPFPNWMTIYLVWGVPLIEITTAILLVIERTRKIGLYSSFILMLLFTCYAGLVVTHIMKKVPCSCGGVIEGFNWNEHFLFNLFFLALSLLGIVLYGHHSESSALKTAYS